MNNEITYDIPTFGYVRNGSNSCKGCEGERVIISPKTGTRIVFSMGYEPITKKLNDKFFCTPSRYMEYNCLSCATLSKRAVSESIAINVSLTLKEINILLKIGRKV